MADPIGREAQQHHHQSVDAVMRTFLIFVGTVVCLIVLSAALGLSIGPFELLLVLTIATAAAVGSKVRKNHRVVS